MALARRLAVIMHRIWVDGTEFRRTAARPPFIAGDHKKTRPPQAP